jgi:hypothetical protein
MPIPVNPVFGDPPNFALAIFPGSFLIDWGPTSKTKLSIIPTVLKVDKIVNNALDYWWIGFIYRTLRDTIIFLVFQVQGEFLSGCWRTVLRGVWGV